jgi:hypothetical protein
LFLGTLANFGPTGRLFGLKYWCISSKANLTGPEPCGGGSLIPRSWLRAAVWRGGNLKADVYYQRAEKRADRQLQA